MISQAEPVIVIGAGGAGLAAADALGRRGIPAIVLEKEHRVAEPWRRRHQRLSLNTHRDLSFLPGARYPAGTPAFPAKAAVIAYLERFAAARSITIEFGTSVERIERADGRWQLHTDRGIRRTAHAIVATGRDRVPWMPDWPGMESFGGRLVHAADFGKAEDYGGMKVLVVGAGNSGFDVLNHLSRNSDETRAGKIWLSARHGPALLPKRIGNIAVQRFATVTERLPVGLADAAIAAVQRLSFGDLARYGLPPAARGAASRLAAENIAIATDDGAMKAIAAGLIEVVPPVARFAGQDVMLTDGRAIAPDVVIAATGYRSGLEEMVGALGVLDHKGTPKATGGEPTGQPGLWFMGMRASLIGDFPSAARQSRAIAARIAAGD